jgi:hypothetical protein
MVRSTDWKSMSRALAVAAAACLLAVCWSCGGGSSVPFTLDIYWPKPAAISYGTPLSATQLDATANVAGTFVYSPASGTVLGVGAQTLSATFTPSDPDHHNPVTSTMTLVVTPATPVISWPTPAAISQGTALSSAQLDATANVAGTFVYSPAAGTVLAAGLQTLSVTFTPSDTTDYTTAQANVALSVDSPSAGTYNWQPVRIVDGGTMTGLYMHPAQQGLMYTRANVGGAYLRDAAHTAWLPLTDWLNGLSPDWSLMYIESIAVDPTDVNRLYLAGGGYIAPGFPNGAIMISDDLGNSFQTVNLPFQMGANDLVHGQPSGERLTRISHKR